MLESRNFNLFMLFFKLSIQLHKLPTKTSTFESSSNWLGNFGTHIYRNSIFYKGPLLSLKEEFDELSTSVQKGHLKSYKNRVRDKLIETQYSGDEIEWVPENFPIYHIPGLRKSERH